MKVSNKYASLLSALLVGVQVAIGVVAVRSGQDVALHWDIRGNVDETGSACHLFLLPGISIIVFLLMTFFEARPHYCNWPCRFNDGRKGYRLLGRLVGVLKLWVTAFLTFVAYEAYRGGRFSYAVAVVFLAVAVVAVCVFAVRLRRA